MLSEMRWKEIVDMVNDKKSVSVLELSMFLNASESTIRRDLTILDQKGLVNKVHGGATTIESGFAQIDDEISIREQLFQEEKKRIAKYAASLIAPGDFIFLDAGTTTGHVIDYLEHKDTIFVTNAVSHAQKLAAAGFKVHILGGEMKSSTDAIVGAETVKALERFHFTKCFMGTNAASPSRGFSTPELNEALVKEKAILMSRECFILCDASKFSKISPVRFCPFKDAVVLTTSLQDKKLRQYTNIVEVMSK
ncbi:MAG: DeoR/GlpR family DNA-binding transcription regulator [Lachnospiraceae bacterium]